MKQTPMTIDEAKKLLQGYDLKDALAKDEPHDIISEIADSYVDIYTFNLLEWVGKGENYQFVEYAIQEFDFPKDSEGKPDFIKAIMQGQYYENNQVLWEAWEEIKKDKK